MEQSKDKFLLSKLDSLDFSTFIIIADELTKLSSFNVEKALETQAQMYSYYGALEVQANKYEDEISDDLDAVEAKLHTQFLEDNKGAVKKPTAKDIEKFVFSQDEYLNKKAELREAKFKRRLLTKLLRALEHRKDMAVQVAARVRKEMDLT